MRLCAAAFAFAFAMLIAGCGGPSATPSSTLPEGVFALPTVDTRDWEGCAGVGLDAVLTGDPTDPRIAWLNDVNTGGRGDVVFPWGFTARFEPALEVLDATGAVVARAGDRVDGACVLGGPERSLVILWMAGR